MGTKYLLLFLILHLATVFADLTSEEAFEFVRLSTLWKKGSNFNLGDCIFYSFGYDKEIPYTKINLDFKSSVRISLKSNGMAALDKCSIALVAGRYLNHMDEVLKKIDEVAESTDGVPIAVFLFRNYQYQQIDINNNLRNDYSPALIVAPMEIGVQGYIFDLMCPGAEVKGKVYNKVERSILLLTDGSATKSYRKLCQDTHAFMGTIVPNPGSKVHVDQNDGSTIIKTWLTAPSLFPHSQHKDEHYFITWIAEELEGFRAQENLTLHWHYSNWDWGRLIPEHGNWSGMVGMIEKDEIVLAMEEFFHTAGRCEIAACLENSNLPTYFFTKYPGPIPPVWNLIRLFPNDIWILTFSSILAVASFFTFAFKFYSKIGMQKKMKTEEVVLVPFRMRMIKPAGTTKETDFGVGSNIVFLFWAIWGGFILHILLSNYLAVLMKPTYNKPIRTVEDVIESGLTIFYKNGGQFLTQLLLDSPDARYQKLGELVTYPPTVEDFHNTMRDMQKAHTHVHLAQMIGKRFKQNNEGWYQGNIMDSANGFGGYVANKKWPLLEEFYYYSLRLADAGLRRLALTKQTTQPLIENVKELDMEHMYFPLCLLGIGLGFSFLAFIFEFISFKLL